MFGTPWFRVCATAEQAHDRRSRACGRDDCNRPKSTGGCLFTSGSSNNVTRVRTLARGRFLVPVRHDFLCQSDLCGETSVSGAGGARKCALLTSRFFVRVQVQRSLRGSRFERRTKRNLNAKRERGTEKRELSLVGARRRRCRRTEAAVVDHAVVRGEEVE